MNEWNEVAESLLNSMAELSDECPHGEWLIPVGEDEYRLRVEYEGQTPVLWARRGDKDIRLQVIVQPARS